MKCLPGLNFYRLVALAVFHQLLSLFWYSPWLFGYKWLRLSGMSPHSLEQAAYWPFLISLISSCFLIGFMAWVFRKLSIRRYREAFVLAFVFWLIVLSMALAHLAFERGSIALLSINMGRDLCLYLLTAVVLVYWMRMPDSKESA